MSKPLSLDDVKRDNPIRTQSTLTVQTARTALIQNECRSKALGALLSRLNREQEKTISAIQHCRNRIEFLESRIEFLAL